MVFAGAGGITIGYGISTWSNGGNEWFWYGLSVGGIGLGIALIPNCPYAARYDDFHKKT
jgi:hypothetical protein